MSINSNQSINDTYGHSFGDDVLLAVARVLDDATSACAKIGRYDGDEFVVFSCFDDKDSVVSFYHRLEQTLQQALYINDVQFSVSVGLACEKDPQGLDQLIAQADKNMYQIKQAKSKQ